MKFQSYFFQDNILHLNQGNHCVPITEIIKNYEKPTYIYNKSSIEKRTDLYTSVKNSNYSIHYAMKANSNKDVLKLVQSKGLSADVVSWGEAQLAIEAGFKPSEIIFSGVGKTKSEILNSINAGVGLINVESAPELQRIIDIARSLNKKVKVGLRINPDISVETHPYIATGFRENKFGVGSDDFAEIVDLLNSQKNVSLVCLGQHIGSQIQTADPFYTSLEKLLDTVSWFRKKGFDITDIDLGGGIGIDYSNSDEEREAHQITDWVCEIHKSVSDLNLKFHLEPGRSIVARSGILISEVQYIKKNQYKNFVILDTGMHHLMRPPLYQSYHRILPVEFNKNDSDFAFRADVVGPICESSDVIGFDRTFYDLKEGDLLAVMDSGAYGFVMSSNYNHHPLPDEILF